MYKTLILITFFLISHDTTSQQNDFGEVYIVNGVEIYILNEPLRQYEIVFGKKQGLDGTEYLSKGMINSSISTKVEQFVAGAITKSKNESKTFDAIIYISSTSINAVKFTELPTEQTNLKAKVHSLNGIPVFVMCEPLNNFKVVKSKSIEIKLNQAFNLIYWDVSDLIPYKADSIEHDLSQFTRRFKKLIKNNKIDALYYTDGKSCAAIKFDKIKDKM